MIQFVRTVLFALLFLFVFHLTYAQRSDLGQVILGDTALYSAYIDFPESWPENVLVRFPGNDRYDVFSAGDVTQFVLGTGELYRAKRVILHDDSRKTVFVELLTGGDVDLYYSEVGPNRFYIQKEKFIPLPRDTYRETVTGLVSEDPLVHDAAQRVLYQRNALSYFFKSYNSGRLRERPFPMPHAGLFFQFNSMRWNVPRHGLSNVAFNSFDLPVNHFSPGLFLHLPFYQPERLGLDIRFSALSYETTAMVDETLTGSYFKDVYFDNSWMQADLALRYTIGWGPFEPYMALGFSYIHSVEQYSEVFYFLIRDGVVTSHFREDIYDEPSLMFGAMIYQGLQYYVFPRTVLAAEWGYGHYLDASGSGYGMNNLFVNMRINFWPW